MLAAEGARSCSQLLHLPTIGRMNLVGTSLAVATVPPALLASSDSSPALVSCATGTNFWAHGQHYELRTIRSRVYTVR